MTKRLMLFTAALLSAGSLSAGFKEPVFALPVMRTSPEVDGRIDAAEWQDATKTLQFIPLHRDVVFPGSAEVWFGRDRERFYIATKMIVSTCGIIRGADPVKRRGNGGALSAFGGDCFEFDFTSDKDAEKETVSHMIVSTIGAYYSTGSENGLPVSWDPPGFLAASTVADGVRTNRFWRHVFEWEGNKIGLSDVVPPPFKPVRREEGRGRGCQGHPA